MTAPNWFLTMPIITYIPSLAMTYTLFWVTRQIWRIIRIEADEAQRTENE